MKFLLILFCPILMAHANEIEDAKKTVQTIIQPLIGQISTNRPDGSDKFRVDQCEKQKINWMNVLLMKEKASLYYMFKPGCDIQGHIQPKVFQPFRSVLKIRNIDSYNFLSTTSRITADIQTNPILNLAMTEGLLAGKHRIIFEADYRLQIDPMNKDNPIKKNLGGELRILEVNGKKTDIKEKILIK